MFESSLKVKLDKAGLVSLLRQAGYAIPEDGGPLVTVVMRQGNQYCYFNNDGYIEVEIDRQER